MRTAWTAALGLALLLLPALAPPPAAAQYTFQAAGLAFKDGLAYRFGLSRHPDPLGFPTLAVTIAVREPEPDNAFNLRVIESTFFRAVDNFNAAPGASFELNYFARSLDPSVTFALDGNQINRFITGAGVFNDYSFVISADLGV